MTEKQQEKAKDKAKKKAEWRSASFKRFIPYYLNSDFLEGVEVQFARKVEGVESKDQKFEKKEFLKVIDFFFEDNREFQEFEDLMGGIEFKCNDGEYMVIAPGYLGNILGIQAQILKNKKRVSISNCTWFYYEKDYVVDDPHESHTFFITSGDEILLESANLNDTISAPLDSQVLTFNDFPPIWANHDQYDKAHTVWLHQKFLNETRMGQIFKIKEELDGGDVKAGTVEKGTTSLSTQLQSISLLLKIIIGILIFALIKLL
jgi:hypothetical protein